MEASETGVYNALWRSKLTFTTYKFGDTTLKIRYLLPQTDNEIEVAGVLLTRYTGIAFNTSAVNSMKRSVVRFASARFVRQLLDHGVINMNIAFDNGMGLLHVACIWRNVSLTAYLVSRNIAVPKDNKGRTAFDVCYDENLRKVVARAVRRKNAKAVAESQPRSTNLPTSLVKETLLSMITSSKPDFDEIQVIIQSNTDFDVNVGINEAGDSLMHLCATKGLAYLDLLLGFYKIQKGNVELTNFSGLTVLMIAAQLGYAEIADILLCACGANPNTKNPINGNTAAHYAAASDSADVILILKKRGADFNVENNDGCLPESYSYSGSGSTVRRSEATLLIQSIRQERMASLINLVRDAESMESCIKQVRATDVTFVDEDTGFTLLMAAANHNKAAIAQELLRFPKASSVINAQNFRSGDTALALAIKARSGECMKVLHAGGANPLIPNIEGRKALDHAMHSQQADIITCLLQLYGTALTGLHSARKEALLSLHAEQLVEIIPVLDSVIEKRRTELVIPALFESAAKNDAERLYWLLEEGDSVDQNIDLGDWPLYIAVQNGSFEVFKLLVERGADVRRRHPINNGYNVLHLACERGFTDIAQYLIDNFCAPKPNSFSNVAERQKRKWLAQTPRADRVEQRPGILNVDEFTTNGKTSLILAGETGCTCIVKVLLKQGASVSILNSNGSLFESPFGGIQNMLDETRRYEFQRLQATLMEKDVKSGLRHLKEIWISPWSHNLRSAQDDTLLMIACFKQRLDVVDFLLQSAVYPPSALLTSPSYFDSESSFVKSLSSPNSRTQSSFRDNYTTASCMPSWTVEQKTPIGSSLEAERDDEASSTEKVLHLFLERRCTIVNDDNLVSHICAVNHFDGRTAFHRCMEGGDDERIIIKLLDKDASAINVADKSGRTALHLACELQRIKTIRKLLERPGIDVNARTLDGQLPEEMCEKSRNGKRIAALVQDARMGQGVFALQNKKRRPSIDAMSSISGSTTSLVPNGFRSDRKANVDWDKLERKYQKMKNAFVSVM